jgi:hypothetical protein
MKKRLLFSCLIGATLFAGCTKNFDKINTDPNSVSAALINPNFLLAQSQVQFANTGYDQLLFQSMWVQSLASTEGYYTNGDKYVYGGSYQDYKSRTWNTSYGAATLVYEMKNLIKGNAAYANLDNCGTILLMMELERVTDAYGDCPFSQALQAKSGISTPVFDSQKSIYASILSQLATATAALDVTKAGPTSDLFYGGNVSKWKKLGYSLMLRAAMRLTKVDAATAQKYAEMAYNGGTMASNADDAFATTDYTNGNGNSNAAAQLTAADFDGVRWGNTLISYLQSTSDPRISAIAEISLTTGEAGNAQQVPGNSNPSVQIGMPNGYDETGSTYDISKAPNYPGASPASSATDSPDPVGLYSRPRFAVYDDRNSRNMLLTYGETELLLAEAATRGWATGVAATHYANALAADMTELAEINATPAAVVSPAAIAAYVAAHPLVQATALQQINMEYYVETSTSFNFNEAFANWRRSGYPVLKPVVYPGQFTDGSIPRRIVYPVSIGSTDAANYASAVSAMGGDSFTTRVYWDSK